MENLRQDRPHDERDGRGRSGGRPALDDGHCRGGPAHLASLGPTVGSLANPVYTFFKRIESADRSERLAGLGNMDAAVAGRVPKRKGSRVVDAVLALSREAD